MNAPLPIAALLGEIELNVGAGLVIVNVLPAEVPPPGVGLNTLTEAVPAEAMSAAEICACSWVLLTNVVVRSLPFQRMTDDATKLLPVAVRVKAPLPAAALLGVMELNFGAGLLWADVPVASAKITARMTRSSNAIRRRTMGQRSVTISVDG